MSQENRNQLLAEQKFLREQLEKLPDSAHLTRMSNEARLRSVEADLAALPTDELLPSRIKLTFNGAPVVGSKGIFTEFAMKAVNSFTDAVATVAASLAEPLAMMGPIPNRDNNQLLITNTAVGSFGFELEEYQGSQNSLISESPVSIALEKTQALLQSTMESDEDLADIASETDPRALDKIRTFLKVLADSNAICSLVYKEHDFRFTNVGQIRSSLEKLSTDNLHENKQQLHGVFVGVLPINRTFEFKIDDGGEIIRGKVSPTLQKIGDLNQHLNELTQIEVMTTQIGNGRPRYRLVDMPVWQNLSLS